MDIRIVNDGQNQGAIVAANVRQFVRANALLVAQVNASGDVVNPGGGSSGNSDGAILDGVNSSIKATVKSDATAIPTSSDSALTIAFADKTTREVGKVTVRELTSGIGVTGDVSTTPKAGQTWPVSVAATISVTEQQKTGVHVAGGQVGITGDVSVTVEIGDVITVGAVTAPVGISGDVSTTPKAGQTWPVSVAATLNTREQGNPGVQVLGGQVGGSVGVTGDVSTTPKAGNVWPVSVLQGGGSGDMALVDGSSRGVKATVRDYANSNPLATVLTNASGDIVDFPTAPQLITAAGRFANQGSNSAVGAVSGKRIKVTSYSLQGDGDNARGYFASGASGSQLTAEWEFATREGVAKQYGGGRDRGYLFATTAGQALSLECTSSKGMKYDVTYFVEDAN